MRIKITLSIIAIFLLQSCASIEITQSRHGNGLGISFGNSKKDDAKAAEFRKRKSAEIQSRKHPVSPKNSKLKPIKNEITPPVLQKVSLKDIKTIKKTALKQIRNTVNQEKIDDKVNIESTIENMGSELEPAAVTETQGDLTNLGYLGGVLVIAGLVLILLGIGNGWSVLVLGVVLIILAYLLG